jgi:hypothetical protein
LPFSTTYTPTRRKFVAPVLRASCVEPPGMTNPSPVLTLRGGWPSIEHANAVLARFLEEYNRQFAKAPQQAGSAYRKLWGAPLFRVTLHRNNRGLPPAVKTFRIRKLRIIPAILAVND